MRYKQIKNSNYNNVITAKYAIEKNEYTINNTDFPLLRRHLKEGIGLIKFELNDGSVYELIDYHLVP